MRLDDVNHMTPKDRDFNKTRHDVFTENHYSSVHQPRAQSASTYSSGQGIQHFHYQRMKGDVENLRNQGRAVQFTLDKMSGVSLHESTFNEKIPLQDSTNVANPLL